MSVLDSENRHFVTDLSVAVGVLIALMLASLDLRAKTGDPLVRVLDIKRSTASDEIGRLGEEGYKIALARLDPGLVVAERSPEGGRRAYLFTEDLGSLLASKRLDPGYRLLPQTLSPGRNPYCAVFEKVEGNDRVHEYVLVADSSPGDLEKRARKELPPGFVPVAINNENGAVAVFERTSGPAAWRLLATRSVDTMDKELGAAFLDGLGVVAAAGGRELVYAVTGAAENGLRAHRLLSVTRSVTLERELNEAAADGFRVVPGSLAALAGGSLLRATNESVVVMQKPADAGPVTYKVVGARRRSTIEREVLDVVTQGFTIVAALTGFEETVVILASPREAAAVLR